MNDGIAWVGVDLDGTLAEYHGWGGMENIGKPIPLMVNRVLDWCNAGILVKIFTARATVPESIPFIKAWCKEHLGRELEVVCCKDFDMKELWDDRAIQVENNTGMLVAVRKMR